MSGEGAAMNEAKQALANCLAYHRVPMHLRATASTGKEAPSTRADPMVSNGLEASTHAPEGQRGEEPPRNPQDAVIDMEAAAIEVETLPEEATEPCQPTQPKRGPGRPKGSRTRPKDPKPTVIPLACQGSTRLQAASRRRRTGEPDDTMDEQPDGNGWLSIQPTPANLPQLDTQQDSLEDQFTQFINEVTTVNEAGNTPEPDDEEELDPESPEYRKLVILKYKQRQAIPIGSSPPIFTTDAPTIEDPNDEV
ncbi:hypothetical protein HAV15_011129 [Penicillium sp. str. |uniref:Uncharacterized protein n=1 Tax=Penicillium thymicola TaxID=293382 RepID=A0AAI9T690_PENTH|nr:hypothetical protein HAV15_011129 [Penicillium sp. str. \